MTRLLALTAALATLAVIVQTSVLSAVAVHGVVPQLALLVVVSVGLARDAQAGIAAGFVAGLVLDLAPPADHTAGRWALALLVAGLVAGTVRTGAFKVTPVLAMLTVAVCSFVASVTFALTGVLTVEDAGPSTTQVLIGVLLDLMAAPLVLPWAIRLMGSRASSSPSGTLAEVGAR